MTADPQQLRVYAWEGEWADWNSSTISLAKAREYIRWACDLYWVEPPVVKRHPGNSYSYSDGYVISFNKDQINRAIALHEVAHHICNSMFSADMPGHSPEWMAIYLWLLIKARIAPKTALLASAKAAGIKWVPLWVVSPKRLAKRVGGLTKRQLRPPVR